MADETVTTNESLKHWLTVLNMKLGVDNCSAKAVNDDQVWQHKSWQEIQYRYEINPQVTMKAKKSNKKA